MKNDENQRIEAEILDYIRRNVALDRVQKVEKFLSEKGFLNVRAYFENWLMESVYRTHKGSYKIDYSKARGQAFLNCILYILFGEPEIEMTLHPSQELRKVLEARFREKSSFLRYSLQYLDTKTGDKNQKTGWINIKPYAHTILGGEIFFYCTLKALIEISKKALTNKKYKLPQTLNWKESIVKYFLSEIK